MSTNLLANLILRCTKVWEDYVEVEWRREFSDGRKTVQFVLKAEAPDLRLSKQLDPEKTSYRISGLPARTTVSVSVQLEVAERDGTTELLPPVFIKAQTLTCCVLSVGSVLPDRLHARINRFADDVMTAMQQQEEEEEEKKEEEKEEKRIVGDGQEKEQATDHSGNGADAGTSATATVCRKSDPRSAQSTVPVAKYQMQVTQIGKVLSHDIAIQEFVPDPSLSSATTASNQDYYVDNVECNARFTAKCRAVSVFGDLGRWSPMTRFLTLLPVNVHITDVGESEVALSWGRGDNDESYIDDACIENLTVQVELLPSQKEIDLDPGALSTHVDTKIFSNEVRRYTVKGLESGRTYLIKTRYRNILGDLSAWDSLKATTLFPVEPCEIVVVGTNFIHVRWKRSRPPPHDSVSMLRRQVVQVPSSQQQNAADAQQADAAAGDDDDDDDVAHWELRCAVGNAFTSATLPGKESETRLTNLSPGVEYAIDVRAVTPTGRVGLWSPVVSATVLHALQPRLLAAGESWIKVAWDRKEAMFRDNIERYHIQINCVSSPFRVAKYFSGDVTRHTFRELKPNTRYQVSIQSFSDGRWGPWGTPASVATCSVPAPRLVRRGEEFIQVEWSSDYYEKAEVESTKQVFQLHSARHNPETGMLDVAETIVDRPSFRTAKLQPLTTVEFKVRSFDYSTNDWGSWGPSVSFRTLPAAIVITHVGETVAEVSWNRIPALYRAISDEQLLAGIDDPLMPSKIAQYQLRVNKFVEEAFGVRDELHCTFYSKANQPTSFVVPDLTPDTDYSVQISYLDDNDHWSMFSSPILFSTVPRLQLEVREVGESRSVLEWGRNARRRLHPDHFDKNRNKNKNDVDGSSSTALLRQQQQQQGGAPDTSATYRIVVQDIASEFLKSQPGNADDVELRERSLPLQFTVQGDLSLVVNELRPNTAYRAEISCSSRNTSWGSWSEPIHFMTLPPISLHVLHAGETFLQVRWARAERSDFLTRLFPNLHFRCVSTSNCNTNSNLVAAANNDNNSNVNNTTSTTTGDSSNTNGEADASFNNNTRSNEQQQNIVWVQGNADGEFELSCLRTDVENAMALTQTSSSKSAKTSFVDLIPDTPYQLKIRSRLQKRLEWSTWSVPVTTKTALATQVRITAAGVDGVTLGWGVDASAMAAAAEAADAALAERKLRKKKSAADDDNDNNNGDDDDDDHDDDAALLAAAEEALTHNFELEIKGFDDNLSLIKNIRAQAGQSTYQLNGLNIGCCYGARARRQERNTGVWGNFCNWHYFALKVFSVQLIETSQDWVHVRWDSFTVPPSALVLTLTGDGQGHAVQVDPNATEHAFTGLTPDTAYAVRLLAVLDRPKHDPEEYEQQKRLAQNRPRRQAAAATTTAMMVSNSRGGPSGSPGSSGAAAAAGKSHHNEENLTNQEVHGAPFSLPIVSSDYFRFAMSGLIARTKKVLLAKFDRVGQTFAVLSWVADGDIKTLSFEVQVCEMEAAEVVDTRTLVVHSKNQTVIKNLVPESRIQCSVRAIARTNAASCSWCPPVEIVLLPRLSVSLNHARVENTEPQPPVGENYISISWAPECSGPDVSFEVRVANEDKADEGDSDAIAVFDTREQSYTLQGLSPDTLYTINVRSKTLLAEEKEMCFGSWSEAFVKSTLSPLAITVQSIRENSGVAYWCRNARVRLSHRWWETLTAADKREDVSSISAFQLHLYERMRDSHVFRLIVDEVIPDNQIDFQQCSRHLTTLRPDAEYEVCIRANTGLQWGRWSQRRRFSTKPCLKAAVLHVRESACRIQWDLKAANSPSALSNSPSSSAVDCYYYGDDANSNNRGATAALVSSSCAISPAEYYMARVTTIRTGDFEIVPLKCKVALERGTCVLSGFEPNTSYSLCLRSHFADGDTGPWGETSYFVTQSPLEVDVANVSETFANILWRRAAQRTIGQDLREQRQVIINELDRSIEVMSGKRRKLTDARSAKLESHVDALLRKRETELELMEMHAEELDEVATYAEGLVDRIEVVCENLMTNAVLESRTLTRAETFCRQADLECNTPYLVKVRTLVVDGGDSNTTKNDRKNSGDDDDDNDDDGADDDTMASSPFDFSNDDNVICLSASNLADQVRVATHPRGLYGIWHMVEFTTLKPIALFLRAVGSESSVFQWDTGASDASTSRRTAITAFNVKVFPVGVPGEESNATLHDAAATGHIVRDLLPSTRYSACVRVCYEGIQWGGWSESVHFSTLDLLQAKIASLDENLAKILVWRETGPNTPPITSHQLLVNGVMCPDPFEIERGASTVLTMDSIALDCEFTVEIADFVCPGEWQRAKEIIRFESLPKPLADMHLTAKKETVYTLAWNYEPKLKTQYIYWLQRAVVGPRALSRGVDPDWQTLACMTDRMIDLDVPAGVNIDWYLFRVAVAKLRQTVDGDALPQTNLMCVQPHNMFPSLDTNLLRWSTWSPPLRIAQPRPPEDPRNLQIRRIFANRAELHWTPCAKTHGAVTYHVFVCPQVEGATYQLAGSTTNTSHFELLHLMPSTRHKVYLIAENNFGRSASTKKISFTTRFDPADGSGSGGGQHRGGGMMMMMDSSPARSEMSPAFKQSNAELLRAAQARHQQR